MEAAPAPIVEEKAPVAEVKVEESPKTEAEGTEPKVEA